MFGFYLFVGDAELQTNVACMLLLLLLRERMWFGASLKIPLFLNYIDTLNNLAIELNMQTSTFIREKRSHNLKITELSECTFISRISRISRISLAFN